VDRVVVVWLVFGVLLLLVELHHLAFFALFAAIGSFAAALVALFAPSAVAAQAGVAGAVGLAGVVAVRPFVSKAFDARRRTGLVARGVHGGLVGLEAVTLDEVGDAHRAGHVRLTGERWLAISGGGTAIPPGAAVVVTAVQGTTLVVWPVEGLGEVPPQIGASDGETRSSDAAVDQASSDDDAPDGADRRTT
jgi:membrane protein implicated in regulation of membrane protease activity